MRASLKDKKEVENVIKLMELLKKAEEGQKRMTEKQKKNNAIKMGDIYY